MSESKGSLRNISVSYEAAYEAVGLLKDVQTEESGGITVYSGHHPEHGNIHIAIPAIGDGMLLLPFALHDF